LRDCKKKAEQEKAKQQSQEQKYAVTGVFNFSGPCTVTVQNVNFGFKLKNNEFLEAKFVNGKIDRAFFMLPTENKRYDFLNAEYAYCGTASGWVAGGKQEFHMTSISFVNGQSLSHEDTRKLAKHSSALPIVSASCLSWCKGQATDEFDQFAGQRKSAPAEMSEERRQTIVQKQLKAESARQSKEQKLIREYPNFFFHSSCS
jgi:hypothetical protein